MKWKQFLEQRTPAAPPLNFAKVYLEKQPGNRQNSFQGDKFLNSYGSDD